MPTKRQPHPPAPDIDYRRLFETMTEGVMVIDPKGHILEANPAAARILHIPLDQLVGHESAEHPWDFFREDGTRMTLDDMPVRRAARGLRTEGIRTIGYRAPDGTVVWADATAVPLTRDGRIRAVLLMFLDVTANRAASRSLERSDWLQTQILDALNLMIHVVNKDLRILLANRALREYVRELGVDANLTGRRIFEAFPFLPDRVRDEYNRVFETGKPLLTEEATFPAGSRIFTETLKIPVREDETVTHVITVLRDVSELKRLQREIIEISSREQQRIGQALHDSLGQRLAATSLLASALAERLGRESSPSALDAARIADLIREAVAHARSAAKVLSPVNLEEEGLSFALTGLAADMEGLFNIRSECIIQGDGRVHDRQTATHLYYIAQEAVTNAARHGRPTRITVRLNVRGDEGVLTILDDGDGIASESPGNGGIGLRIMRLRADTIGAALSIGPAPSRGTLVTCRFPNRAPAPLT